ncbi:MAG: hypothetical protein JXN59_01655 [Anaerolineae bacterium]|nr:hypothetical protein [Anaerolineae bacterium]
MDQVHVKIDDRVRLMSALLAATSWPDFEQERKAHGTHAHARATRRLVQVYDKHPAALILQALLDRGLPLEDVFAYILGLDWPGLLGDHNPTWAPPTWARHLLNFYEKARLEEWWAQENEVWSRSITEAQRMLKDAPLASFLRPFVGEFSADFVFVPNLCYPTDIEVGVAAGDSLYCITPPRVAWGDNPPWPFDEDPAHIFSAALVQYGRLLMSRYLQAHPEALATAAARKLPISPELAAQHDTWEAQFLALFGAGSVAIYLEDHISPQEAQAYILLEKKARGLVELPGVVSVLRRYLSGHAEGNYADFADYLPYFGKHLRVARTITAL